MTRPRLGLAAALLAVLAVTTAACTSHAKPPPKASVYLNGDITRIPLSGSAAVPLVWTQPATLDATQQAVALSDRRFLSLALIIGGPRPAGVRFNPLLEQLLTGSLATSYIAALGDGGSHGNQTPGRQWRRVLAVSVAGSTATVRLCTFDAAVKPIAYSVTDHLVSVKTDLGSSWRTTTGPETRTAADQARCGAWGRTLPAK